MTHTDVFTPPSAVLTALAAAIEVAVNTALGYDPASQQQMASITDILALEISLPALVPAQTVTLYCHGTEDGIRVMTYCEQRVTTQLKGSLIPLLLLLKQPVSLANTGVVLVGNVGLLQRWQTVLQQLDIDWEDAISLVLGDIAGPISAAAIRRAVLWSQQQQTEQQRLLTEYLSEELQLVPSQTELDNFSKAVGELSMDTERLNARLAQLAQDLHKKDLEKKDPEKSPHAFNQVTTTKKEIPH